MSKYSNVHVNVTRKSFTYLYILGHPISPEFLFKDGALAVLEAYTEERTAAMQVYPISGREP